jgi:bacillithiol biosynthesis deacetylase BshB1
VIDLAGGTLDALAIGAHPDDVELCCGGTLALLAARGRRVGILHLTSGEAGTRGTPAARRAEAAAAARELGAVGVEFLDCGDGSFRAGPQEEDALIEALRRLRPELVFGPTPADRHPDHARAHRLVADACFYAGLAKRGPGPPHRPGAVFSFMQHDPFAPTFIVDVTSTWGRKIAALRAYRSQIHQADEPHQPDDEPPTRVASPEFLRSIEGRARHYGLVIGVEFGEPYWAPAPLAVADPLQIVVRGMR